MWSHILYLPQAADKILYASGIQYIELNTEKNVLDLMWASNEKGFIPGSVF